MSTLHENTRRIYYALDEHMTKAHREGDDDSRADAERTAHSLIQYADLPLLIRCRALCILGCSNKGNYVHYAEQSVYFAKLGLAQPRPEGESSEEGELILKCCEEGLAAAKAFAATAAAEEDEDKMKITGHGENEGKSGGDGEGMGEGMGEVDVGVTGAAEQMDIVGHVGDEDLGAVKPLADTTAEADDVNMEAVAEEGGKWANMEIVVEDEEEYNGDPDDEELAWDPDWSDERKQQAIQEEQNASAFVQGVGAGAGAGANVSKAKKPKQFKKVRRVHSGDTDEELLEELDLSTGEWVPLGTAIDPQLVGVDVDEDADMLFKS
jgi:hypothetical protein